MNASDVMGAKRVSVVGAGLVGMGWAIVFARAGLQVQVHDLQPEAIDAGIALAADQIAGLARHGLLSEAPETVIARLHPAPTLAQAVEGVAWLQESVLERVDVKRQLMEQIEAIGNPDLVVGSSTSGIPASEFVAGLAIASRVIVAHPVNPPYLVPVVELVPSPWTDEATIRLADAFMRSLGQSVVTVRREVAGFVLNRLQAVLLREAWALVQEGVASCEDIDKTVRDGLGWRWSFMGSFEAIDLNAPGGVADYAQRLGPLYQSIAQSRSHDQPWDSALIKEVESQRRTQLSFDELSARRAWRDEQLMAFAKQRLAGTTDAAG